MSRLPRGSFVADICVLRVFGHRLWPPISFVFLFVEKHKNKIFCALFSYPTAKMPSEMASRISEKKK